MKKRRSLLKTIFIIIAGIFLLYLVSNYFYWNWHMIIRSMIVPLIIIIVGIYFLKKSLTGNRSSESDDIPSLSPEKESHYVELGMTEQEITFFRETMASAKKQIKQLEKNMNSLSKLKAINLRNDTLKASKAMFKEMVKEPTKLHQADRFLYAHLPNIVELTDKYIEINDHEIKNKSTYEALNDSAEAIDAVSKLIVEDYNRFVSDDLEELEVEISIAKQNINRDNSLKEDLQSDNDKEENHV
ncbi:5-bromo-4-chloroindolyl phosphate hydrolysis family protein [Vagococcus acidifermentans]|uniref:5-bromo-4-chloroindolyl phosphate hydrolysis protein n=1 Tax=Vagococcus acidifermentans TaxID=564710 RepID=A0A430AS78_9ENTE|nr:5-bromo-4-chloroindolyl phosphate hydrolysis family protein [Vagococcus acidifermentans]RSU10890.1 hypothetical protein CBF27_09350 [Vagococcus acidifermentans]